MLLRCKPLTLRLLRKVSCCPINPVREKEEAELGEKVKLGSMIEKKKFKSRRM